MLRLDGVTVAFGGVRAVQGVTLRVAAGEVVGLVGPNGAGKTTVFNAVTGLVHPSSGQITFEGRSLRGLPVHRRARLGIGRTFQVPRPMHQLTVRQNLMVAQRFSTGAIDPAAIDRILEVLGLRQKAEADAATELALTEWKALEVAKALATHPRLVLFDEVLAGLETESKRVFAAVLAAVRREFGLTMIVIEHDIATISALCPRVVVLDFGQVIGDGAPAEVFRQAQVVASYLGQAHA